MVILGGYFARLAPGHGRGRAGTAGGRPPDGACRIAPATLGTESAALGAAARILDHIDDGYLPELA